MRQRKKKNEETTRHPKNPWRVERRSKYPGDQNSKEESIHHKNKERQRRMHHISKRNCRRLWRTLQKILRGQRERWLRTWNEWWQKNTRDYDRRVAKRNQQTQKSKSTDSNGICAEDIKACDDETREMVRQLFNEIIKRNNFTPEEWKKVKIKVIHQKGDVENVSNYRPICSLLALYKLFSTILYGRLYQCLTRDKQKIWLDSEKPTRQQTTLQHTDWLNRNAMGGEAKCGQRRSTSRRRSTPSLTKQLGRRSNLATSITSTSASWGRYTETRRLRYRQTKRATFSTSRKDLSKEIRCPACCSTQCFNTLWRTKYNDGKRRKEWEYTWEFYKRWSCGSEQRGTSNTTDKKWCSGTWWRTAENEFWSRSHLTWWTCANLFWALLHWNILASHSSSITIMTTSFFETRQWIWYLTIFIPTCTSLWQMEFLLAMRWRWLERVRQMTWTKKSTTTMEPRDMRAREASAGDRRAIADADQAGQLDISGEAKTARSLRTPEPPTDAVRLAHNATHVPFRDWCPICVASRGRSSPHKRVVGEQEGGYTAEIPDRLHVLRTVAESKTQPCITFVGTRSGVVISFMCARKGGYEQKSCDILKRTVSSIQWSFNVTKRWVSLTCVEKLHANETRTVLRIAPKTSHQSKRVCRSSARTHTGTRTMLPDTNWDEHWLAAFSTFTCHSICDSLRWSCSLKIHSATRRQNPLLGTQCVSPLCMFGESLFALIPDHEVRAAKLTNRWISGCLWGRDASSYEHLVETKHGLLKCRSVRRKPPGEHWSRRETIEARGTKWNFDVEMDFGIPGPTLESRRDEGMPTATAPMEILIVPPPEEHVPEMRGSRSAHESA